ncbi:MAG: hypothetical protein B7X99_05670 [Rhizobiales bacterium 17-65-6]|nr:MAG: hypothetical protein B7Z30_08595 [Rhizobiales bacterium 12-68-15]OYX86013.1 MAG: hypothetical protein B7Y84_14660 [Azorhizobium sp. 32-67-21]OZA00032.1 MAG: hypothetical protein B7X99_05670 [Rhizobiales bacterium 17-65-6]
MTYTKPEYFTLKTHPDFNEKWVQNLIASDPSILGLGDLVLRDKERIQPRAGRLDLLLQDIESKRRYEIEIQLGSTDETHIIRTIEYWDIERKRYPQYEHCAVLIAEDITSRFLNVISLFNGTIPLIAIQMRAARVSTHTTLIFTTVMDELSRGLVEEDEDAASAPTDRNYWEKRGSKLTLQICDELLSMAREIDPTLEQKYNKFYVGLSKNGQAFNFIIMRPRKSTVTLEIKLPKTEHYDQQIESAGIDTLNFDSTFGYYRLSLNKDGLSKHRSFIGTLLKQAYEIRSS